MKTFKGTKGEWFETLTLDHDGAMYYSVHLRAPNDDSIFTPKCIARNIQSEANAKLVAAAPELLEALQEAIIDITQRCTDLGLDCTKYSTWQKAQQAINKAL